MYCLPKNLAGRHYVARFGASMGAYVLTILGAAWAFKHHAPTGPLAYVLALLPGLAIVGTIVSVGMYIAEETDEFQRTILVQSMMCAIGATLSITTVWGIPGAVPEGEAAGALPGVSAVLVHRRHYETGAELGGYR